MSSTLFFYYCCEDCYSDWWQGSNCEWAMAQKTLTIYTGTWYCRRITLYSTVSSTAVEIVDRDGDERWTSSIAVFYRGTEHVEFYIGAWECHGRTLYVSTTDVEMLVKIVTLTDDRVKRLVETWHRSHLLFKQVSESDTAQNSDPCLLHSLFTCCGDGSERFLLWEMTEFKRCVRSWHRTLTIYTRTREPHVRSKQVFYCFTTIQRNVFMISATM